MAGHLNAKHLDWNCRLITTRGRLLCNYTNENSCLIYGPDTPITISIQLLYHPQCPKHLAHEKPSDPSIWLHTPCWAEITYVYWATHGADCRSQSTGSPQFQMDQLGQIPGLSGGWTSNPNMPNEVAVNKCTRNCPALFLGVGRVHSQELHTWWPASPHTESYSGWNMSEQPAKIVVENH
jgi:hypothetical protein